MQGIVIERIEIGWNYATDPPVEQPEKIVWSVPTGRGRELMRADRGIGNNPDANLDASIVVVRAPAFYALWQAARGQTWGFSHMPPTPEELPTFVDERQKPNWRDTNRHPLLIAHVGLPGDGELVFVYGQHRTLWLLLHETVEFLVMVREPDRAAALHGAVGTKDPVRTIREIMEAWSTRNGGGGP